MPPGEVRRVGGIFEAVVNARQPIERLENTNRHKDGRLVVLETSAAPIFDGEGCFKGYRGTDRNVTEQKRQEEQLRKLLDELKRSNQELEQFAYVASHDLQEPLRMVSSYTQLLGRALSGSTGR